MIRLGFVGAGMMGQAAHLRNYAAIDGCELAALAETRPKLGAEVARRFGIPKLYPNHSIMLEREELDGIVAILPFTLHGKVVPELLERRIPVLTEKPLAGSSEDGRAICEAANHLGTRLYLGYHKRCDPATTCALERIRKWQQTGERGELRYIRVTMPPGDWSLNAFSSNVRTDESFDSGAGPWDDYLAFVNYYIHQVNLIRFLAGEDYEPVHADKGGVTMSFRTVSGVSGVLEMAPYNTTRGWQESALVCFERGFVRIDLPAPMATDLAGSVTIQTDEGEERPVVEPSHAMRKQAEAFLAAIRGEPNSLCGAEEGLKDLLVADRYMKLYALAG